MGNGVEHKDENLRIREFIEIDKSSLPPDGGTRFNRLIFATSPYLLQHAHNPVDWYPWGRDALAKAQSEDKPIFLSIGYAACHWCHVMERESFENENIARLMNQFFVSIKVDREERPDLDAVYMNYVQMLTGSGGWPLNVFLTPDQSPFFGGTYFPPEDRGGLPGFPRLVLALDQAYRQNQEQIADLAGRVIGHLQALAEVPGAGAEPSREVLDQALPWLEERKDKKFFAWLHLYDPHTPYEPPPPYDKLYAGHPYLGEIAFADSQIARLWSWLESNGLLGNTFIVFAGDHGESLGEHEEQSHGFFVYQGAIHVPLIVVTPFPKLQGVISAEVTTLADVLPTVCDMAGLPVPAEVQGRSLLPAFFGRKRPETPLAYSETYYPRFHFGWQHLRSMRDGKWKYLGQLEDIERRYPRILRRVGGYNLDRFTEGRPSRPDARNRQGSASGHTPHLGRVRHTSRPRFMTA